MDTFLADDQLLSRCMRYVPLEDTPAIACVNRQLSEFMRREVKKAEAVLEAFVSRGARPTHDEWSIKWQPLLYSVYTAPRGPIWLYVPYKYTFEYVGGSNFPPSVSLLAGSSKLHTADHIPKATIWARDDDYLLAIPLDTVS